MLVDFEETKVILSFGFKKDLNLKHIIATILFNSKKKMGVKNKIKTVN